MGWMKSRVTVCMASESSLGMNPCSCPDFRGPKCRGLGAYSFLPLWYIQTVSSRSPTGVEIVGSSWPLNCTFQSLWIPCVRHRAPGGEEGQVTLPPRTNLYKRPSNTHFQPRRWDNRAPHVTWKVASPHQRPEERKPYS